MEKKPTKFEILSSMFLVGGTCVGGGMLALPVSTGISGFIPSGLIMVVCWIMMTLTALLLLEVSLWMKEGAHMITMSEKLLGPLGRATSWVLYLFISYCSLVAYTAGGGMQLANGINYLTDLSITKTVGCIIYVVAFGIIIDLGTKFIGRVNTILFSAVILSYLVLVVTGIPEVDSELIMKNMNWRYSIMAIPLLLTSFSFQTMVPSLTPYLKRHEKSLRWSIIGGTTIAFIITLVWQYLVLGIVPLEGPSGLAVALARGEPATEFLREIMVGTHVATAAQFFAVFALMTSFLGMALGLYDFLSDGLKIPKKGWGKIILGLIIVLPTLFFAIYYERAFIVALESSGGFGDSILNGIMPVLMVWVGRYHLAKHSEYQLPGGKYLLSAVLLFFVFTLTVEILLFSGVIFSIHDVKVIFEFSQV